MSLDPRVDDYLDRLPVTAFLVAHQLAHVDFLGRTFLGTDHLEDRGHERAAPRQRSGRNECWRLVWRVERLVPAQCSNRRLGTCLSRIAHTGGHDLVAYSFLRAGLLPALRLPL